MLGVDDMWGWGVGCLMLGVNDLWGLGVGGDDNYYITA